MEDFLLDDGLLEPHSEAIKRFGGARTRAEVYFEHAAAEKAKGRHPSSPANAILCYNQKENRMAAGDQVRNIAQKSRLQAKLHREQANNMHKSASDLERLATQLEGEATNLERQARESDDTEKRAQQTIDKLKTQNP